MISRMAMEDIEALRADSIDVPPREVVRLNALGLRAERGPYSAELSAAPRVAFVGGCVLREPTLGAEMWLRQTFDAFDGDDGQTFFSLRVLSCLVPWRELPDPSAERAVRKAIKSAMKSLGDATVRQVSDALEWCIDGRLPEQGEKPPPRPSDGEGTDNEADELPERYSPEFGLFHRGMAVRIGTAADMKDMTYSAMLAACERAEELATVSALGGGRDRKAEKSEALGDYMRALDAVRDAQTNKNMSTTTSKTGPTGQIKNNMTLLDKEPSKREDSFSSPMSGSSSLGRPQTASIGVMTEEV